MENTVTQLTTNNVGVFSKVGSHACELFCKHDGIHTDLRMSAEEPEVCKSIRFFQKDEWIYLIIDMDETYGFTHWIMDRFTSIREQLDIEIHPYCDVDKKTFDGKVTVELVARKQVEKLTTYYIHLKKINTL